MYIQAGIYRHYFERAFHPVYSLAGRLSRKSWFISLVQIERKSYLLLQTKFLFYSLKLDFPIILLHLFKISINVNYFELIFHAGRISDNYFKPIIVYV